jgi:hypothetical protein
LQHLQLMRRAGIVAARRDGKFVLYRLSDEAVLDLLSALRRTAERLLPRALLRPVLRGGRNTARARVQGAPTGGRFARVARGRPAGQRWSRISGNERRRNSDTQRNFLE